MLKTTQLVKNLLLSIAEDAEVDSISGGGNREDETVKRSLLISKNWNGAIGYLTPKAKLAFTQLSKVFTKALIFRYFDLECYIRTKTDVSNYTICGVLSQLALNNLGQWHLVAFYLQKMILAKTWYKTYDGELLAIVEAFKTWRHYLKDCKHKILVKFGGPKSSYSIIF